MSKQTLIQLWAVISLAILAALTPTMVNAQSRESMANHQGRAQMEPTIARTDSLSARASPAVRIWVREEGRRQAQNNPSEPAIAADARERFGNNLSNVDIDALLQLVMAETVRDAEQELRDQLAQMHANNHQKQAQRSAAQKMRQDQSALRDETRAEFSSTQSGNSREELAIYVTRVSDGKDSLSDMSEMQQMRMQMYMDRRQKALEMLSNLLKKESDTSNSIIGNLK